MNMAQATPIPELSQTQTAFRFPPCDTWAVRHIVPRLGIAEVRRRVKVLIACAEHILPVEGGATEAICYAERESGLWPWAINPSGSGSEGLYQVIASTWLSWWRAYPVVRHWIRRASPTVPVLKLRLVAYANAMLSLRVLHNTEGPWAGGRYVC